MQRESKLAYRREQVARDEFIQELRCRCIWAGTDNKPEAQRLAQVMGVSQACGYNYLKDPGRIPVSALQKLVKGLKPDPGRLLRFLGYSNQEIKAFAAQQQ